MMMTRPIFMIMATAMAFVARAVPIEERQFGAQTANFDDLTTPTVVSLTPLGVYQGLNYTGISLATQRVSTIAGNPPQSPSNDVYYSSVSGFTPTGGSPSVSIPTTSLGLFTPNSLYFGCNAGTPVTCTFTVTGSRGNVQTAQQTFQFNPTSYPAPLKQAVLTQAGFVGVDKIEFSTVYSVFGIKIPGNTVLDTFEYVITAI